jgi:hypothetical protein
MTFRPQANDSAETDEAMTLASWASHQADTTVLHAIDRNVAPAPEIPRWSKKFPALTRFRRLTALIPVPVREAKDRLRVAMRLGRIRRRGGCRVGVNP